MAARRSLDGGRSLGSLLSDLASGAGDLVRHEVRLAKMELQSLARGLGVGTVMVVTGGVLLLLGAMALLTGIILLLGAELLPHQYWLAALIVTVLLGAVAAFFAVRGKKLLDPARLAPDQTVDTLREDKEWLKRQLTSGATSS